MCDVGKLAVTRAHEQTTSNATYETIVEIKL